VNVKQAANASPRPSMVVKANPAIGLNTDTTGTAAAGAGWIVIGPITVNPTSDGATWVELRNNLETVTRAYCYWDHIVTT
jgi:hypothetical protein